MDDLSFLGAHPSNTTVPNVNFTVLTNNTASISFPVNDGTVHAAIPLAGVIFDEHMFRTPVWCTYPISSQYNSTTRYLFYVTMVFSFIWRRHPGIATAALGSAMIYSAIAALHMVALLSTYQWTAPSGLWDPDTAQAFGDIDLLPISAVLGVAALVTTPIMNWSASVRGHKATFTVVSWGAIIKIVIIPAWVLMFPDANGHQFRAWKLDTLPSIALCPKGPDCNPGMQLDRYTYPRCGCNDFCGFLSPRAPLRSGQQMVVWLPWSDTAKEQRFTQLYSILEKPAKMLGLIMLSYGLMGLLASQFSQLEIRNLIFRICNVDQQTCRDILSKYGRNEVLDHGVKVKGGVSRLRLYISVCVAAIVYFYGIVVAIFAPLAYTLWPLWIELRLRRLPYGEGNDAVGAWAPWAGAGLIVVNALLMQCKAPFVDALMRVFQSTILLPPTHSSVSDPTTWHSSSSKSKASILLAPVIHVYCALLHLIAFGKITYLEFVSWTQDPISRSYDTHRDVAVRWAHRYPRCLCAFCADWIGDSSTEAASTVATSRELEPSLGMKILRLIELKVRHARTQRGQPEYTGNTRTSAVVVPVIPPLSFETVHSRARRSVEL